MTQSYHFLLFDLDGTLSESAPGIIKGVEAGLAAVGIHETDPAVLETFIGPPLNVRARELYHMKDEDIVTFVNAFRVRYEDQGGILDCRPYEGVGALLAHMKKAGRVLAVASSKPEPFVKTIMDHFGFTSYFTVICGSGIGDELTPRGSKGQKALIIQKALSRLSACGYGAADLAGHTIMIGDTGYDIDGAKSNHLPSVGVTYGYGSRQDLIRHGADAVVDSPAELEAWLLAH